eukprot:Tamp_07109.p1 GENE.Tamp_07109~~Tamp_07109.p1  ORF type:complete len:383 (+),score=76.91 Tamp_07109:663-1811(+)
MTDLLALEPNAEEAPRKYKILFSCSRKTTASDGPSGEHGPFARAMLDAEHGFFAEGVPLRDAIESVSRAVQSSSGSQAPTVLGSPDALPAAFCIYPPRGVEGSSSGGGTTGSVGVGTGQPKSAEPDEALLSLLRATGLQSEAGRLAEHGVWSVADVDALREEDLPRLGMRFRRLLEHRRAEAMAEAEALVQLEAAKKAEEEEQGCAALENLDSKVDAVRISGVTGGWADSVNGVYHPVTGEACGDRPVYKKEGGDVWIEYWSETGQWKVNKGEDDRGKNVGMMFSAQSDAAGAVEEVTVGWKVGNDSGKGFSVQEGVRVLRKVDAVRISGVTGGWADSVLALIKNIVLVFLAGFFLALIITGIVLVFVVFPHDEKRKASPEL